MIGSVEMTKRPHCHRPMFPVTSRNESISAKWRIGLLACEASIVVLISTDNTSATFSNIQSRFFLVLAAITCFNPPTPSGKDGKREKREKEMLSEILENCQNSLYLYRRKCWRRYAPLFDDGDGKKWLFLQGRTFQSWRESMSDRYDVTIGIPVLRKYELGTTFCTVRI